MADTRSTTRRLLALALPEKKILAVATVALLVSSAVSLVYPQAVRSMVDQVTGHGEMHGLDRTVFALLGLFLVSAVFAMLRAWLFTVAGERVVARLRSDLFGHLVRQEVAFFDKERTGELTNRLASDTTVLQNTVTVNVSMALRYAIGSVGGVAMLLYMSPKLTGLALLVVPVVAIGAASFGGAFRRITKEVQDALGQSTEIAEEVLSSIRTVRSFARERAETDRYAAAVDRSYRLAAKRALVYGSFTGVLTAVGFGAIVLVVWMGGRMVLTNEMTIGELTAFLLYTLTVAASLSALSGLYADLMKAIGASERVFELLDRPLGLEAGGGRRLARPKGDVTFEQVRFSYPTRPDHPVLEGFDLRIHAGEVVALVGPSGAGKSTIAALLARFYDPTAGRITIDGTPLDSYEPGSLREHIGMVAQEPVLFATTIEENIRYGRPAASSAEIEAAAEAAHALEFISAFPDGMATPVGERGVQLSGGQKQRVAIARAILKDPAILVLDEATSALDSESEHLVQEALDRLMEGRTTLVIAHRLSTVRDADRVVVLEGGKVVEEGTHDALLARDGLYRRLVERQFEEPGAPAHRAAATVP
jgi:ABC transporter fused permease/ATP-binding protein